MASHLSGCLATAFSTPHLPARAPAAAVPPLPRGRRIPRQPTLAGGGCRQAVARAGQGASRRPSTGAARRAYRDLAACPHEAPGQLRLRLARRNIRAAAPSDSAPQWHRTATQGHSPPRAPLRRHFGAEGWSTERRRPRSDAKTGCARNNGAALYGASPPGRGGASGAHLALCRAAAAKSSSETSAGFAAKPAKPANQQGETREDWARFGLLMSIFARFDDTIEKQTRMNVTVHDGTDNGWLTNPRLPA